MKTYLQMDGDQLVEYVEKREYDDLLDRLESLKDALIDIEECCYEDDSENAAADASWHIARKALKKLKEQSL